VEVTTCLDAAAATPATAAAGTRHACHTATRARVNIHARVTIHVMLLMILISCGVIPAELCERALEPPSPRVLLKAAKLLSLHQFPPAVAFHCLLVETIAHRTFAVELRGLAGDSRVPRHLLAMHPIRSVCARLLPQLGLSVQPVSGRDGLYPNGTGCELLPPGDLVAGPVDAWRLLQFRKTV